MAEMIDARMVEQRQVFTIRTFTMAGTWADFEAADVTDALRKNDAAIAAVEAGLLRSYHVRSQWAAVPSGPEVLITDELTLSER